MTQAQMHPVEHRSSAAFTLGVISVVVGVLALIISWIPFLGLFAIPVAVVGGLPGVIGLVLAMSKGFKGALFPILGLVFCGGAVLLSVLSTSVTSRAISEGVQEVSRQRAAARAPVQRPTPSHTVTADQLFSEYRANELAADERYKGRVVRVSGTLQEIGRGSAGQPFIVIGGGGYFAGVRCHFSEDEEPILARLGKGQSVIVEGRVQGLSGAVVVRESQLK